MRTTRTAMATAAALLVLAAGCATEVAGSGQGQTGDLQSPPVPIGTTMSSNNTVPSGSTAPIADSVPSSTTAPGGGSVVQQSDTPAPPPSQTTTPPIISTPEVPGSTTVSYPPPIKTQTDAPVVTTPTDPPPSPPETHGDAGAVDTAAILAETSEADPDDFPGKVTEVGFETPSGNIWCGFTDYGGQTVTCQIQQFDYTPEPARDCHGGGHWGGTMRLVLSHPVEFRCAGDLESGGPTLPYGQRLSFGDLICASQQTGVTCWDSAGSGFWVSRAAYRFF